MSNLARIATINGVSRLIGEVNLNSCAFDYSKDIKLVDRNDILKCIEDLIANEIYFVGLIDKEEKQTVLSDGSKGYHFGFEVDYILKEKPFFYDLIKYDIAGNRLLSSSRAKALRLYEEIYGCLNPFKYNDSRFLRKRSIAQADLEREIAFSVDDSARFSVEMDDHDTKKAMIFILQELAVRGLLSPECSYIRDVKYVGNRFTMSISLGELFKQNPYAYVGVFYYFFMLACIEGKGREGLVLINQLIGDLRPYDAF